MKAFLDDEDPGQDLLFGFMGDNTYISAFDIEATML